MEYQHDESLLLNYKFLASNLTSIPIIQNFKADSTIFGFNLKSSKFVMDLMQDFKKPTDKNLDEKKSKMYNALKSCVVHLQNSNHRHDGLHGLSRKCLLGMGTLSDNKRDTIQNLKWELDFWKSVVCRTFQNGSERPETKNDPNAIRSLNAVLSFDTEWQTQADTSKNANKMDYYNDNFLI